MGLLASVVAAGVLLSAVVLPLLIKVAVQVEHDRWSVPAGSVEGKVAIVTGANSGLGLETARVLATAGATVPALPRLVLDPSITDIDDFAYEHIKLEGYTHHPSIKAPISV